jgi:putative tryptophan/tyrosine transport system substrate-binding protein
LSRAWQKANTIDCLAAELVTRQVNVIAALAPPAAFAAKAATTTIPIVFVGAFDPVKAGLVASLNRPGGNVTGVTFIGASLGAKRLELARELAPNADLIALLTHPYSPDALEELHDLLDAAKAIGQRLLVLTASSERDFDAAFDAISQHPAGALIIGADPFFFQSTDQLVALMLRHRIPTVFTSSEAVVAGGLVSYSGNIPDAFRLAGVYAGRILKGAKPPDLPVQQPTKYEPVINLKTAKALGLDVPDKLLALADEVIE